MRITVNLSIFFHDHRSLAKIFINKNMKCIRDVEQHLTDIFGINNFYLKCDNQYLPPCENVQILDYDDLVWVVPENNQDQILTNSDILEENILATKKKKKKKKIVDNNVVLENNEECHPLKIQRKSKKRKHQEHIDYTDETENKIDISKKKKKSKKSTKIISDNIEPHNIINNLKDSGRDSLDNSRSEDSPNENNVDVKSLVSSFEKKKLSFDKKFENVIKNENERKINIVKTIIISPNNNLTESKLELTDSQPVVSNDYSQDQQILRNATSVQENSTIHDEGSKMSVASSAMDTISSMCCSFDTEHDANVNKRKRKRTRTRRKRSTLNKTEFNTSFEQPVYNFVHKQFVVQTPKHLRFEEGEFSSKKNEVSATSDLTIATDKSKDSTNDVIVINESIINDNVSVKSDKIASSVINLESTYSVKQIEECIAKQPITENTEPRLGDVIAFKILRISDSYTPEVSTTIVGKVLNYISESKDITFDILYGQDQCSFPQGKFSLEDEEQPTESNTRFSCTWNTLLEPRLVFP